MGHRTALVTAGSVALVVVAGAIAIGANIGILNAADSRPVGKLSAASGPGVAAGQAGDQAAFQNGATPGATAEVASADDTVARVAQEYVVKKAGSVTVAILNRGVRLVDVRVNRHWRWTLEQSADKRLSVAFYKGDLTYTLKAKAGPDGELLARVDHPVTRVVVTDGSAPAVASQPATVATVPSAPATAQPVAPSAHHVEGGDDGEEHADD